MSCGGCTGRRRSVDLGRVHPSWLVRALREESPAVQRLVAASLRGSHCVISVQAGLLLDSQDLISERAAAPEVASWVMALWTERLVGGEAERADDPPALIVLGRLSPRRVIASAGWRDFANSFWLVSRADGRCAASEP